LPPPWPTGSPRAMPAPWSRITSDFFAAFFGFVLRRSFVPASGVAAPGGKVVVVVLWLVVVAPGVVVVVVAEHPSPKHAPALLVADGGASAKSVALSCESETRVRLIVPSPGGWGVGMPETAGGAR